MTKSAPNLLALLAVAGGLAVAGPAAAQTHNPCGAIATRPVSSFATTRLNPCSANPCAAKKKKAKAGAANPCAANPCSAKANPCAANPCAAKANPCAANPCAATARKPS